ncbi:unnamed protein product [Microthlaspi erraticum]|uniref:Uncharacterized protein n=1 Tax=Microthlaspi erraticum TaxID=1685480 RepID=A0A6D2KDX1_9BRAS|nr:unnamed protein product [Microthlaspi erraticum]
MNPSNRGFGGKHHQYSRLWKSKQNLYNKEKELNKKILRYPKKGMNQLKEVRRERGETWSKRQVPNKGMRKSLKPADRYSLVETTPLEMKGVKGGELDCPRRGGPLWENRKTHERSFGSLAARRSSRRPKVTILIWKDRYLSHASRRSGMKPFGSTMRPELIFYRDMSGKRANEAHGDLECLMARAAAQGLDRIEKRPG